jgi:mono/diheme cytochrome c family protein
MRNVNASVTRRALAAILAALGACAALAACGPSDPNVRLWRRRCASCHGEDGRGRTKFAEGRPFSDLTDDNWRHGSDLPSMIRLIRDGDPKSPMPAFRDRLTPEEIDAMARYVQHLAAEARNRPQGAPR